MNILTVSLVRNEGDILEAFVRHHAAFVSRMVIIDHRSQDNSREILESLKKEGLPIDVRFDDGLPYRQAEALTEIAHEYAKKDHPDWIVPLDGDEFLVTLKGESIPEALNAEGSEHVLHLPWHCYVPMPDDNEREPNVLKRITHRRSHECPQWWKAALPRTILEGPAGWRIGAGSHLVHPDIGKPLEASPSTRLALAHFPIRSAEQITRKIAGCWISDSLDCARRGAPKGANFQWKAIFDELQSGKELTTNDATRLALSYATTEQWNNLPKNFTQGTLDRFVLHATETANVTSTDASVVPDPIRTSLKLRYPHHPISALAVLLKSAEDLAAEYVRLTMPPKKDR